MAIIVFPTIFSMENYVMYTGGFFIILNQLIAILVFVTLININIYLFKKWKKK